MIQKRIPGTFVETIVAGQAVRFFVHNPSDVIQRHHLAGEFYEAEELHLLSRYVTPATRYLDVGANVGNHAIYLYKISHISNIFVIEPHTPAIVLLQINLALNGMETVVDTSGLGVGLSDCAGKADMVTAENNLGRTYYVSNPEGLFPLTTGDELLGERAFDLIKIDVEGMEVMCLNGMQRLIARCRPMLFVEVDNVNQDAFLEWCAAHRYGVKERFRRYPHNESYLVAPFDNSRA